MAIYGDGRRTTALAASLEAGFGSYAQFHRVLRAETGQTPTALRRAAAHRQPRAVDSSGSA